MIGWGRTCSDASLLTRMQQVFMPLICLILDGDHHESHTYCVVRSTQSGDLLQETETKHTAGNI